jgi:hypothetical protein
MQGCGSVAGVKCCAVLLRKLATLFDVSDGDVVRDGTCDALALASESACESSS